VSGIPELVRDGESGLLVSPDDPAGLATSLEALLSQPELRARLVAGAREAVKEYDLTGCVSRLRALFLHGPLAA
jgi:glycosyltransferase involved in cell wall biosynthesis